jgi:hypothetical protein
MSVNGLVPGQHNFTAKNDASFNQKMNEEQQFGLNLQN